MKIIVLDTNILIDNVHGYAQWVDTLVKKEDYHLIVPTIVVAEYLTAQDVEDSIGQEKSRRYISLFKIQDLNYEIAEVLGRILRRKMHVPSASMADLIVASTALYLDVELATRNKSDFAKIPQLRFFDPRNLK